MDVLIIPDSFKGSLTASEVSRVMEAALKKVFPSCNTRLMPFSDGGEGALAVLQKHAKGTRIDCATTDALARPIKAPYFAFSDQKSAWVELSQTAGLAQLKKEERNPLITSTRGTGKMIRQLLEKNLSKIYIGIGGSATQDLGTGILSELGVRFLDEQGKVLPPGGGELYRLAQIDLRFLNKKALHTEWIVACDVQNPLLGKAGTAHTYAQQKGASAKEIDQLERGGVRFAEVVQKQLQIDLSTLKGGGAAGGVSAGLYALLNAQLVQGFELLATATGLKKILPKFDLVLTGEGRFDEQSLFGKLPIQVAIIAKQEKIPTIVFAGHTHMKTIPDFPNCTLVNTTPPSMSPEKAMLNAEKNLFNAVFHTLQNFKSKTL
ncbi:MAG: glycerate kinase [Flavobacteriaceae bacterium]